MIRLAGVLSCRSEWCSAENCIYTTPQTTKLLSQLLSLCGQDSWEWWMGGDLVVLFTWIQIWPRSVLWCINLSEAPYQVINHLTSSSVRPLRKSRKRLRVYPKITDKPLSLHPEVPGLLCPQAQLAEVWLGLGRRKHFPSIPLDLKSYKKMSTVSAGSLSASVVTGPRPEAKDGSAGEVCWSCDWVLTHPGARLWYNQNLPFFFKSWSIVNLQYYIRFRCRV